MKTRMGVQMSAIFLVTKLKLAIENRESKDMNVESSEERRAYIVETVEVLKLSETVAVTGC